MGAVRDDPAICAAVDFLQGIPSNDCRHRKGNKPKKISIKFCYGASGGISQSTAFWQNRQKSLVTMIVPHNSVRCCGGGVNTIAITALLSDFMGAAYSGCGSSLQEGGLAVHSHLQLQTCSNAGEHDYSVISPRGSASILWKDASREAERRRNLKISQMTFYPFEYDRGYCASRRSLMRNLKKALHEQLKDLSTIQNDRISSKNAMKSSVKSEFSQNK